MLYPPICLIRASVRYVDLSYVVGCEHISTVAVPVSGIGFGVVREVQSAAAQIVVKAMAIVLNCERISTAAKTALNAVPAIHIHSVTEVCEAMTIPAANNARIVAIGYLC